MSTPHQRDEMRAKRRRERAKKQERQNAWAERQRMAAHDRDVEMLSWVDQILGKDESVPVPTGPTPLFIKPGQS